MRTWRLSAALLLGLLPASSAEAAVRCGPVPAPGAASPAPAGADVTSLGRAAPAAYELYRPSRRPVGVMLGLHGGGWMMVGPALLSGYRREARWWTARGWAFAAVSYRPCHRAWLDVRAMHDLIRRRIGPRMPLCVTGESAGGHLALLLAAYRPRSVRCVVAKAAPANATTLARGRTRDPRTGVVSSEAPALLASGWRAAFGRRWSTAYNPAALGGRIRAGVLLAIARWDAVVPTEQATSMPRLLSGPAEALVLPSGDREFVHGCVSAAGLRSLERAQARLAASVSTRAREVPAGRWPARTSRPIGPMSAAPCSGWRPPPIRR